MEQRQVIGDDLLHAREHSPALGLVEGHELAVGQGVELGVHIAVGPEEQVDLGARRVVLAHEIGSAGDAATGVDRHLVVVGVEPADDLDGVDGLHVEAHSHVGQVLDDQLGLGRGGGGEQLQSQRLAVRPPAHSVPDLGVAGVVEETAGPSRIEGVLLDLDSVGVIRGEEARVAGCARSSEQPGDHLVAVDGGGACMPEAGVGERPASRHVPVQAGEETGSGRALDDAERRVGPKRRQRHHARTLDVGLSDIDRPGEQGVELAADGHDLDPLHERTTEEERVVGDVGAGPLCR